MKRNRFTTTAALSLIVLGCLIHLIFVTPLPAQELSQDQIDALQEKLASLKLAIENRHSQLNTNAGDVFLNASQDPAEAVALYFKCHKMVNYDREGREEREFDDWKDDQRDRIKDPRFLEGLQTQLRYLALTCKAAEAKSLEQVFPSLLSYGDGLMRLTEMPGSEMLQDVSSSIFARAFQLEKLLERNESWEMVPFNIAGIYEKTVLPYLRENDTEKLMGAWDRRIAQQTQLVTFLESLENRGNRRDDRRQSENEVRQMQGGRTGGIIRAHDQDDFLRDTLPELNLGKLKDMFLYIDQAQGGAALIAFIEGNLEHEKAADWLQDISAVLAAGTGAAKSARPAIPSTIPSGGGLTTAPPESSTDGSEPSTGGTPTTSGKIPPGLVPAN